MKVFFIDLDNTMFFGTACPAQNAEAIMETRKKGNLVILNTGRGKSYIPWDIMHGAEYDGIIAGLGSYVEFGGKAIYTCPMSAEDCSRVYRAFENSDRWNKFEGVYTTFYQNLTGSGHKTLSSEKELLEKVAKEPFLKFTCARLDGETERSLSDTLQIFTYDDYSEGAKKGESKGKGIRILLDHLKIGTESCIALGDSKNDIEMFKICKEGAAMANSEPELFKYATYRACHAAEGGVSDAIRYFT